MVSMKPGSGTMGLDPDLDDYSGSPADVERRRRRKSEAEMARRTAEAEAEAEAEAGGAEKPRAPPRAPEMARTRYGGPPPGTHGPWRWGQLVKGSAPERVSL